jgi:hypothetical protein
MVRCALMIRVSLLLLVAATVAAQEPRKQIAAVPAESIKLDGRLDEPIWATAPAMTGFTQRSPNEGAPATDETVVRFAYDDSSLWIGARMQSAEPSKIAAPVTRRDDVSQAEHILVSLDTFLDRRTAYTFGVTAAGTRTDRYHSTDVEAGSATFDPVWEAKATRDAHGWTAEMRIPFSQLRFNESAAQTFGVNVRRVMPSKNENDYWIVVPRKEVGWASRFGDLTGLEIGRARRMELLPYASGSTRLRGEVDPANPLDQERVFDQSVGADIKAGIGPNLTLDATINPDFGQVEADPAVVNLGAFETFFTEQRPFFVEGASLLAGGGQSYFYSRRIGAAPSLAAILRVEDEGYLVDAPRQTRILGAAKLTGRFASGTSIGALAAVTDAERARTWNGTELGLAEVAPRTFFGVFRGQQQFGKNGSTVGGTATVVQRDFNDPRLVNLLNERAVAAGTDWNLRFKGGEYEVGGYAGFSRIDGSAAAITRAQRSSARYFQRPDNTHTDYDPTRTSLSGFTAGVQAERAGGKHWLFYTSVNATSPGFEINDAGRISQADQIFGYGQVRYRETEPRGIVRDYEVGVSSENGFNFGGTRTWTALRTDTLVTWKNFWGSELTAWMDLPAFSDRATRGGVLMGTGRAWVVQGRLYNSRAARNRWLFRIYHGQSEFGEHTWDGGGTFSIRPKPRWQLSLEPRLYVSTEPRVYAGTRDGQAVFALVDRDEYSLRIRANYAVTPDLTFELYTEPFAASGRFHDFGALAEARGRTLVPTAPTGTFDYNLRSFRSNAVVRWEWRPGSTMYVVWQQDRFSDQTGGTARFSSLSDTLSAPGDNIVAVKFSYWLPL